MHDIFDFSNEKYYKRLVDFLVDFAKTEEYIEVEKEAELKVDKKIFEPIGVDLIILSFMASCSGNYVPIKQKIIFDYILEQIPQTKNLSSQYLETYIENLKPTEKDFYTALSNINYQNPDAVAHLCQEVLKVCLADGRLHYREKLYLAELLQFLREAGIKVDLGI